jgi:hypothetical protein
MLFHHLSFRLAASLVIAGSVSTVAFAQSPELQSVPANDPERPVRYISLRQAYEMALKDEAVGQKNQNSAEQLRILKPLSTRFVSAGGVCVFPEDQPEPRIRSLFKKATDPRKAGKNKVAQAYYESISCLHPESNYAKEATRLLEEMKDPLPGERPEDLRYFTEDPHPNLVPVHHFWFLKISPRLIYETISGSTDP